MYVTLKRANHSAAMHTLQWKRAVRIEQLFSYGQ